jgi:hypothetical protein
MHSVLNFAILGFVNMKEKKNEQHEALDVSVSSSEKASWDTIWKWTWFLRKVLKPNSREELKNEICVLHLHLSQPKIKSILDCSCGLGFKERGIGYNVAVK